MKKRILALAVSLVLMIGLLPGTALAVYPMGDINRDGEITNSDLLEVVRYCVEIYNDDTFGNVIDYGDVNGDGYIDNQDVITLARIIVGLDKPVTPKKVHASFLWCDFEDYEEGRIRNLVDVLLPTDNELEILDVEFDEYAADWDVDTQLTQLDTVLNYEDKDIVFVSVVDQSDETVKKMCDMAKAADAIIVFVLRPVSQRILARYENAYSMQNNYGAIGAIQGDSIGWYLADNYDAVDLNGDGVISYILFRGEEGNPEADMRTEDSVEYANIVLDNYGEFPNLRYYDTANTKKAETANWSYEEASDLMTKALEKSPMDGPAPIELVISNNDDMALGAIEALNNAGWNLGELPSIPVFGMDMTRDGLEAIRDGKMTMSFDCYTEDMAFYIEMILRSVQYGFDVFAGLRWNVISEEGSTIYANFHYCDIDNVWTFFDDDQPEVSIPYEYMEGAPEAAVLWYDFSDYFLALVRDSLDEELHEAGFNITDYNAASSQEVQNGQIDTAIANGADVLIVNVVDIAAVGVDQAICDKAKEADVPIIFFNREVQNEVLDSYAKACYVGVRYAEAGELQGQMAGEYIVNHYDAVDLNKDGKISYIMMKGEEGNPDAEARTLFSVENCNYELSKAGKPALKYYDGRNNNCFEPSYWSKAAAFEIMETALISFPMDGPNPIEVVFANNDDAAIGAAEALFNVGWNRGGGGKSIPVFGIDYTDDAAEAMAEGKMTGSILQSYNGIAQAIRFLADNVKEGRDVFSGARDNFTVDVECSKIRVHFEIMLAE